VRGPTQAQRAAASYGFEGKSNGGWARLATEPPPTEFLGKGRVLSRLALSMPMALSGVRIVSEGRGEAQIDELTLLHAGRPYVWLWGDTLGAGGDK
jgi:hypothetical protein